MNFSLNEGQKFLQKLAKDFTINTIDPIAPKMESDARLPDDLIGKFAHVGLLGMTVPGNKNSEASTLDCSLVIEQIAYSGTGAWWLVAFNNSIPEIIHQFGSEGIKQKYLAPLCNGTSYGSVQFTEEETGSDPEALTTKGMPEGEYYVINGMKRFSTFGDRNGCAIVYVKDENGACTAFIIEKKQKGYSTEKSWELMGAGGIEAVDVYFQDMHVPKENIVGIKGKGFDILLHWIAIEKIMQSAANIGMAQAALDEAIRYVKARKSRGKLVSGMQGIRWILAEMKCKLEAARYLTYRAASLYDVKDMNWKAEAASTKLFVIPATLEIIDKARQLHGCYGYVKDFKIERLYRGAAGASSIATSLEINRSIVGGWLIE